MANEYVCIATITQYNFPLRLFEIKNIVRNCAYLFICCKTKMYVSTCLQRTINMLAKDPMLHITSANGVIFANIYEKI